MQGYNKAGNQDDDNNTENYSFPWNKKVFFQILLKKIVAIRSIAKKTKIKNKIQSKKKRTN